MQDTLIHVCPRLREDLTLHQGPPDQGGAPTWTLHDPARNQYFSLDWVAFEVIARLSLGSIQTICSRVNAETMLRLEPADVLPVLEFLERNELVQRTDFESTIAFAKKHQSTETSWSQKFLHGYLFFRIPLVRPDAWLAWCLPRVQFLFSAYFLKLTLLVGLVGMWGVYRQWDSFQRTLVDTLSLDGLLGYGGALVLIKVLHELGHALMAKRFGCRVPIMGVAFLVMWPTAYTDVTESWKLSSHRQRLLIAAAGMATELMMACWMLLAWVLLPPGHLRDSAFFLATTSLIATLAINASPLMRFDGYFLLCDFLGQPNLHARSFAMARWWLREKLFRLGDEPPEDLSMGWRRFFIAFAWVTWLYRLVLFLGIAVLVYHYFFKVLGLLLFGVEIWFFVMRPVWGEMLVWRGRWHQISSGAHAGPAIYLFMLAIVAFFLPLDLTVNGHGMLKPEKSLNVVSHLASKIEVLPAPIGTRVTAGTTLLTLQSPELINKIDKAKIKVEILERQFSTAGFSSDTVKQQTILKEQLDSARQELTGLESERQRLRPVALFDGVVTDVEADLFVGEWIPKGMNLVRVIDQGQWVVDTYVDEVDLRRIDLGYWGWFVPEAAGLSDIRLRVISIDRNAVQNLPDAALATVAGGQVTVRVQNGKLFPERTLYRVRLKAIGLHEKMSTGHLRGRVVVLGWPKSVMGDLASHAIATLIREASF